MEINKNIGSLDLEVEDTSTLTDVSKTMTESVSVGFSIAVFGAQASAA